MSDSDNVFEAVVAVGKALGKLTPEAQQRVLDGVAKLLGQSAPLLSNAQAGAKPDAKTDRSAPAAANSRVSLVEFMNQKQPATNGQKILTFAAFFTLVEGKERFTKVELSGCFARARTTPPKNFDRDFGNVVGDGGIAEDEHGLFLTQTGEKLVTGGFAGRGKARGGTAKAKA